MTLKRSLLFIIISFLMAVIIAAIFHKKVISYVAIQKLEEMGYPVTFKINKISQKELILSDILIAKNNKLDQVHIQYKLRPRFSLTAVDIEVAQYDLAELQSLGKKSDEKLIKFEHCKKLEQMNLKIAIPDFNKATMDIGCSEDNVSLSLLDFKYQVLGPFSLKTTSKINNDPIKTEFELSVANDVVATGNILYFQDSGNLQAEVEKRKESLELAKLIEHLAPKEIQEQLINSSGKIKFYGSAESKSKGLNLDIKIQADNVNVETKDYKLKNASLRHSVKGYPSLKSGKRQSFKANEISVGAVVHDVSVLYEIESTEKILVNEFKAKFEGAEISTGAFRLYPQKKQLSPADIKIEKLSLEKFLKMALGDTATATGQLSGKIKIEFKDNKPIIEYGELRAQGPGTIQYRPPNSSGPPDPNSYSADPMVILNSYLYDFHYTELSVSMSSDVNYEMKMTLTALGKNPGYLGGKALKLNVNLEQNLLAAFQAMMLSYNLPKRLEERITNLGQ